jgi:hypothetical protein
MPFWRHSCYHQVLSLCSWPLTFIVLIKNSRESTDIFNVFLKNHALLTQLLLEDYDTSSNCADFSHTGGCHMGYNAICHEEGLLSSHGPSTNLVTLCLLVMYLFIASFQMAHSPAVGLP